MNLAKHFIAAVLVMLAGCRLATAQTNLYNKGEIVAEAAPTISAPNLFSGKNFTIGYSVETEDWETAWTGTGLEIGTYDASKGGIDHMAVMQDFRYPLFSHFAVGGKTGAETRFDTGAKGVEVGGELYWTFGKGHSGFWTTLNYSRVEVDIEQHSAGGMTGRFAWQIIF